MYKRQPKRQCSISTTSSPPHGSTSCLPGNFLARVTISTNVDDTASSHRARVSHNIHNRLDVCALHSTRRQQKAKSPQASTHTQSRLSNLLWILCDTLARWLEDVSSTLVEMVRRAQKLPGRQEVLPCCGEDVVDIEHWRLGGQHTHR